jgi:surface protein
MCFSNETRWGEEGEEGVSTDNRLRRAENGGRASRMRFASLVGAIACATTALLPGALAGSPFTDATLQTAVNACLASDNTGVTCVDDSTPGVPIADWDVSAVTDMQLMFNGATAFNQDISGWDVSAVTNMGDMFNGATAFNQDISGWDVRAVTNMISMFSGATAFTQNITGWNTAALDAQHLYGAVSMFRGATAWNAAYNPRYLWVRDSGPPSLWTSDSVSSTGAGSAGAPGAPGAPGASGAAIEDFPDWGIALVALSLALSTVTSIVVILRVLCAPRVAYSAARGRVLA